MMNLTYSFVLIIFITISAFGVIFVKYQNRMLNIEISKNEKRLFYLSELHIDNYYQQTEVTDRKLQKKSFR